MLSIIQIHRRALAIAAASIAVVIAVAACSKSNRTQTAAGRLDTTSTPPTTAITQSAGPGAQVTATDGASVNKATEYRLTPDNFQHFLAAADSLVALSNRDSTVRNYLSADIAGSGSSTPDAGLKRLQSNPAVDGVINSAGISTYDYFVASIAIADAEQFLAAPKDAPATPTGTSNAEFLRAHMPDVDHLKALHANQPTVTVTP